MGASRLTTGACVRFRGVSTGDGDFLQVGLCSASSAFSWAWPASVALRAVAGARLTRLDMAEARSCGRICTLSTMAEVRPPTVRCEIVEVVPSGCNNNLELGIKSVQSYGTTTYERKQNLLCLLLAFSPSELEEPIVWETLRIRIDRDRGEGHRADLRVQHREQSSLRGLTDVRCWNGGMLRFGSTSGSQTAKGSMMFSLTIVA